MFNVQCSMIGQLMESPLAAIPAIAFSAYAGEIERQQAREAGFQQYITKPLDLNKIVATAIETNLLKTYYM